MRGVGSAFSLSAPFLMLSKESGLILGPPRREARPPMGEIGLPAPVWEEKLVDI